MAIEIRVPTLGESISEATVGKWFKKAGETVRADEPLVELETDKVTLEVNAPGAGVLSEITADTGETVSIGALLGEVSAGSGGAAAPAAAPKAEPAPKAAPAPSTAMPPAPSAAKIAAESKIDLDSIAGSGKRGQVLKGDVLAAATAASQPAPVVARGPAPAPAPAPAPISLPSPRVSTPDDGSREERVRMTKLRQTIARRLKDAQNTAAMLTTFNEVDMSDIMAMRARYKDAFEKKHGVKLGFMGFFVKACVQALKAIADLGKRARDGQLKLEELQGGTFTITNGGIYGSLMSTPILNAPQSGILGMHKIQERPVAVAGKIEIRPMMYLALSYDHRVVDGKEAVTFLVRVKEALEDPGRLVLDI